MNRVDKLLRLMKPCPVSTVTLVYADGSTKEQDSWEALQEVMKDVCGSCWGQESGRNIVDVVEEAERHGLLWALIHSPTDNLNSHADE